MKVIVYAVAVISVITASLLVIVTGTSSSAYACNCMPPTNPLKISDTVFLGKLEEIVERDYRSPRVVKFKVEKYWKGEVGEHTSVTTTAEVPCGYNFQVGVSYLVYAGRDEHGQLETAPCRILAAEVAKKDLRKLGKGSIPKHAP